MAFLYFAGLLINGIKRCKQNQYFVFINTNVDTLHHFTIIEIISHTSFNFKHFSEIIKYF